MADVRVDDRDLRLMLGTLEEMFDDVELTGSERAAYERLCKVIKRKPQRAFEQQSLGFLGDDEPPHPDEPHGIAGRARHYLTGHGGMPWPPRGTQRPIGPPPIDPAKQIADKMARASKDAVEGNTPPAPTPKRALTDEEKDMLRRALDGDDDQ
jgi:hypothetical protein